MPTPNTVLTTTAVADTTSVRRSAASTDGSANASVSAVNPWANVVRTTNATGQATNSTRWAITTTRITSRLATAGHPPLDEVEGDDDRQRDHQQDGRHRRCG